MTISILQGTERIGGLRLGFGAASAKILGGRDFCGVERRRSDRVEPGQALATELGRVGPSRIVSLSLGGATVDSPARIEPGVPHRLLLEYRDLRVEVDIVTYRTKVQELFYAANGRSWICYRSHAVFQEPSVAALNLVYRVIADHWVAPGDDDTRPASV